MTKHDRIFAFLYTTILIIDWIVFPQTSKLFSIQKIGSEIFERQNNIHSVIVWQQSSPSLLLLEWIQYIVFVPLMTMASNTLISFPLKMYPSDDDDDI